MSNQTKRLRLTCSVKGDGLWGAEAQTVTGVLTFRVTEPEPVIGDVGPSGEIEYEGFAEGRFYLDEWDDEKQGLIYTDSGFIDSLHLVLDNLNIDAAKEIDYSESGMQGPDYVSMDASYNLAKQVEAAGYDISIPKIDSSGNKILDVTKGEQWYESGDYCAAATKTALKGNTRTQKELLDDCLELLKKAIECC